MISLASHVRNGAGIALSVVLTVALVGAPPTCAGRDTARAVTVTSQTSFGAEERFEEMVPIPPGALAVLRPELLKFGRRCGVQAQSGDGLWASAVRLDGDALPALLVSGGTECLFANAAPFWVLQPQAGGAWIKVFQAGANTLDLLDTKTRGLRDIRTVKVGPSSEFSILWEADGAAYRKVTCERRAADTNDRWRTVSCSEEPAVW